MKNPTYLKQLQDGETYEFGVIEYGKDRRRDRMIARGIAASYEEAKRECNRLAAA